MGRTRVFAFFVSTLCFAIPTNGWASPQKSVPHLASEEPIVLDQQASSESDPKLSRKWIPFLIYKAISGYVRDRYFPSSDCEKIVRRIGIRIHGDKSRADQFRNIQVGLNRMLGDLAIHDLDVYLIQRQNITRSFLLYDSLFLGTEDIDISPEKTSTIFSHELAHVVFKQFFRIHVNGTPHSLVSLNQRVMFLQRKKNRNSAEDIEYRELNKISESVLAYNETFADLVAVLFLENPSAIAHAHDMPSAFDLQLLEPLTPQQIQANPWRNLDFTANIDAEMWSAYFDESLEVSSGFRANIHYKELTPVRGELWRSYIQHLKPEQRSLFLKVFLEAASQHLKYRSSQALIGAPESNLEVNRGFLATLAELWAVHQASFSQRGS